MYKFVHEKRLFDQWGRYCDREWNTQRYLGVNWWGFAKRSALDRIGEGGQAPGPVRYTAEPGPVADTREMELISRLMQAWERQMPTVHQALMARHRNIMACRKMGLAPGNFRQGTDQEKAWHVVGDSSWRGVRRFYEWCEGGYRILRVNLREDMRLAA